MTSRIFRSYSPRFARTLKLGALVLAGGTGYAIHAARAAGVPAEEGIVYAGVATDGNGTPLTGNQNIGVAVWNAETAGSKVCEFASQQVALDSEGNFRIVMDDCADAMHGSANLWVEVSVNGSGLGRTKIGAVPYALEAANAVQADLASDSDLLEGKPAADFAAAAHAHAFSSLTSIPADLADGDADTKYTAGTGLDLSAQNAFSVDPAEVQTRVTGACTAGNVMRSINQAGTVNCAADADTTYLDGPGLLLTSNQFRFDSSDFTWCGAGQTLRSITGTTATCDTSTKLTAWTVYEPELLMKEDGFVDMTAGSINAAASSGMYRRVGDTIEVTATVHFNTNDDADAKHLLFGIPTGVQPYRPANGSYVIGTAMVWTAANVFSQCAVDVEAGLQAYVYVICGADAIRRSQVGSGAGDWVAVSFQYRTPVDTWTLTTP
jgi:hypothetical protein